MRINNKDKIQKSVIEAEFDFLFRNFNFYLSANLKKLKKTL